MMGDPFKFNTFNLVARASGPRSSLFSWQQVMFVLQRFALSSELTTLASRSIGTEERSMPARPRVARGKASFFSLSTNLKISSTCMLLRLFRSFISTLESFVTLSANSLGSISERSMEFERTR